MGIALEKEFYLNNDRLAYLLMLLINNGIIIENINKYQAESFQYEFKEFVGELSEFYVQTHHSNKKNKITEAINEIDDENIPEEFSEWYTIKYTEEDKELEIILRKNGEHLKTALKRYYRQYWNSRTSTWDETNHNSGENACELFYNKIKAFNTRDLHIKNIDDIHAILIGYFKGDIKINKIQCEIDLSAFSSLIAYNQSYPTDLVTEFYCHMNAKQFCLNYGKGKYKLSYKDPTEKKPELLEPQQWVLLGSILKNYKKEKSIYIPYKDLKVKCFLETGTDNARRVAIKRFNERFGRLIEQQKIIMKNLKEKRVIIVEIGALKALHAHINKYSFIYKDEINEYLK